MTFVCASCRDAAGVADTAQDQPSRLAAFTLRRTLHNKCRGGTWCDCQHRESSTAR